MPDSDARIAELELEAKALQSQLAAQQGRIDVLLSKKPPPDRLAPIISGAGAAVSSLIAVSGFGVVHFLSVRRQHRDEFFKRVQDCLAILERIGRETSKVLRRPGKDKDSETSLETLQADFDALTYRLALMERLQPKFKIAGALVDLKREAMLNIEDENRPADVHRANRAVRLAQHLAMKILEQHDQVYGKAAW